MNVFIIPSWHPTKERPTWCNWVRSHISLTKRIASTVVLYVDSESNKDLSVIETEPRFFFASVTKKKNRLTRTLLFYGIFLWRYCTMLDNMYSMAVKQYGTPDLIHAHVSMPAGFGAAYLRKKYGIPTIVTEHYSGTISDNKYPWRLRVYYTIMRKGIDGFYTVSPGYASFLQEKTHLCVNGITPNPVNTDIFHLCDREKFHDNLIRICSTGSWGDLKGTDILIQSLGQLPPSFNWEAIIIGEASSSQINTIPRLIKKKIRVIDKRISQNELAEIYRDSDIYVMSSRFETANVSMLEAMACGCQIVCNRIGTSETLLDPLFATFFDGETRQLSNSIQKCSETPISPNDLFNFVNNHYSIDSLSEKLRQLYSTIVNKTPIKQN